MGGDGGSVSNVSQRTSTAVSVDIIAGNGGSTVNYGSTLVPTGNVGRGGSGNNILVDGEIGTSLGETASPISPPIRAYNDLNGDGVVDETMAQFIANTLTRQNAQLFSFNGNAPADPNVAVGNVGIVAGVAGRVAAVNGVPQPASGVPNGAVQFVTARNIMSIVAGSVDSVSPVDNVIGLRVTSSERILGADKSPLNLDPTGRGNGVPDYLDLTGRVGRDLQPGDRLVDGAIFAFANTTGDLAGNLGNPRVFIVPQD